MRLFALCFFFGILLLLQFHKLPGLWLFCLIPLFLFLFYRFKVKFSFALILTGFLCGFLWALFRAEFILSQGLEKGLEGQKFIIQGVVVSLPEIKQHSSRFIFDVDQIKDETGQSIQRPGRVRLSWYRTREKIAPGETWQFKVKLKRPYGFMNPGGFDYEYWLFHQNIRATGYIVKGAENQFLDKQTHLSVNVFRYRLKQQIEPLLRKYASGGLITGLILGDRSGMQQHQWEVLRNTGTSHLLAISGLHIGFIFALVFFLTKHIVSMQTRLLLYFPASYPAMILGLVAALFYAALAGFSLPTQRALIMLFCAVSVNLAGKQLPFTSILAMAFLFVLILDPFSILTPGFYLSFMAVGIILYGMSHRMGLPGLWWRWGRVQTIVALGLFPLTVFWFQSIAWLSIPANLIAIPVVSIFIVPLSLLATVCSFISTELSSMLFQFVDFIFQALWYFLQYLSQFNVVDWNGTTPGIPALVFALLGMAILFMPQGLPGRPLGLVCLLPLFFTQAERPRESEFWATFLDVGQGLSVFIETRNHSLLYDTGARFSPDFDLGQAVVVPFLLKNGISSLDRVIISHGDNDHVGGLDSVLDRIPVAELLASFNLQSRNITASRCLAGQHWRWDGIEFEILHPGMDRDFSDENNASCVLKISEGQSSLLLTGDIEKKTEISLVQQIPNKLSSKVLLVPHHGSKTSSTSRFIDHVRPDIAVIASGYRNRFGLPKKVIMQRYRERGIDTFITAQSGAIRMLFDDMGVAVTELRETHRRFWHTIP